MACGQYGVSWNTISDDEYQESTYIPIESLHRLENPGDDNVHLIEVQTGDYFGEDDIERFGDIYGRVNSQIIQLWIGATRMFNQRILAPSHDHLI